MIVIEGKRIVPVGSAGTRSVPADARVIFTGSMTVMQGLRDTHLHLMISRHPRRLCARAAARIRNGGSCKMPTRTMARPTEGRHVDIIAVQGDVLKCVALLQDVGIVIRLGRQVN